MNISRLHSSILRFAELMAYKTRCNCIPSSSHSAFIWSKQDWRHSRTHHTTKADCYSISNAKSAPKSYCFEFGKEHRQMYCFKNTPAYTSVFQQITSITFFTQNWTSQTRKEKKTFVTYFRAFFCSRDDGIVSYTRQKRGLQSDSMTSRNMRDERDNPADAPLSLDYYVKSSAKSGLKWPNPAHINL